jgi:GrpB-like predicted nucleotidyltransferase (UPF0157 family)
MAKAKTATRDVMTPDEVAEWNARPFYREGVPYQWVMSYGWVIVGYYVGPGPTPLEIRVAHASYYRSAGGQTHASLAANGGNEQTTWEYFGDRLINRTQVQGVSEYAGEVRRARLAS